MNLLKQSLLIGGVFVLALLTAGLLILVHRAMPVSPWWQLAEIGIVLIIYGLVEMSTRINMLSLLRSIRNSSKAEAKSPSFSVYEPARIIPVSTSSTLAEINAVSPPAIALKLIAPNQFGGAADPEIYLHQDFLYSQN